MYELVALAAILIGVLLFSKTREGLETTAKTVTGIPLNAPPPVSRFNIPVQNMPPEFAQALELYRMNYVEYRATGKAAYKTAYEAAEKWIQKYMENLRKKLEQDANYVNKFTREYAAMNPELSDLQSKMKKIQVQGPQLQDKYTTVKNLDQTVPMDTSSYYVKGLIVAAVVGVAVVVTFF